MASVFGFVHRAWQIIRPPLQPAKAPDALKFGILGAANVAPYALFLQAKQHPDVVIHAVAARDKNKADAYAKKHGIPVVFGSYQELLDDPSIDAVYIPLPNGLHFEWALKALAGGKHVLLEKPSVSNATEAEALFRSPLLLQGDAPPVILEAFHYKFHPAWLLFMSLLDQPNVARAEAHLAIGGFSDTKDIRFNYELAGGALMDLTYTPSVVRAIFGAEPTQCTRCDVQTLVNVGGSEEIDAKFDAEYTFPNGGTGVARGNLRAPMREMLRPLPFATAVHKPEVISNHPPSGGGVSLPDGQEELRTRTVTLHNFIASSLWHRIDIIDEHVIRKTDGTNEPLKKWTVRESKKAYTLRDAGNNIVDSERWESKEYWLSYKYQLDAFVDRVRGRVPVAWVDGEDSIAQMRAVDMAYLKAGLKVRPTSRYYSPPVAALP
ncbi:hypothetical protein B0H63DRAFT_475921 [Podospora didyma]|uniref:D-xylose 1-dehydrogenase (NADP(+), D-xylono-1,5-lactone-forming) n=1 Tax=Podospora didyma TaxID=330526 RepID=A0AAE0NHD4_9PEZI|nr:hypothetical protein B0H63DRAFT_475921 [Podospora didyma]